MGLHGSLRSDDVSDRLHDGPCHWKPSGKSDNIRAAHSHITYSLFGG